MLDFNFELKINSNYSSIQFYIDLKLNIHHVASKIFGLIGWKFFQPFWVEIGIAR